MTTEITACRIWGEDYRATGYVKPDPSQAVVQVSDRTGGGYIIPGSVRRLIEDLQEEEKALLTSWLVDQRDQGNSLPTLTAEMVQYATNRQRIPVYERAERLLRFMADQPVSAGEFIDLTTHVPRSDIPTNPVLLAALAWTESTSRDELGYLADYLEKEGLVQQSYFPMMSGQNAPQGRYQVTVPGYARVSEQRANVASAQVFVAMWFDPSLNIAYYEGIEPAIRDCGYDPKRIIDDLTVDKIDDSIVAEIRRSRFLVADFTHGKEGARGGVYYEAGFAHGLGIDVIFTCRRDMIDNVHFDTRQYAHILWDNASDLRSSLRDRILARIG